MKNGIKIVVSLLLLTMVGCAAVEKVENRAVMSANNYTERVVAVDSVVVRDSVSHLRRVPGLLPESGGHRRGVA